MTDQLIPDGVPPAARDGLAGRDTHGRPPVGVGDERGDAVGQRGRGVRHEVHPGVPVVDDVEQAARGRRHHRDTAGLRLLGGLAERLVGAGVDEHVETREDRRQLRSGAESQEGRPGQAPLKGRSHRTVTDDDQPHPGEVLDRVEQVHPLLPGEPAHVADQYLPVGGEIAAQGRVAVAWVEPLQVDPARPAGNPVDALAQQHVDRGPGRRQRPPGEAVDGGHPPPDGTFGLGEPVAGGEAGEVGLVHGHARQPEPPGGERGLCAQSRRGRQMHDVRPEVGEDADQPGPWSRHPERRISWQRNRRRPQYRGTGIDVGIGCWRTRAGRGRDDERFVATLSQMLQHPADRVGHAVDVRQERLGDHCDAHDITVPSPGDRSRTAARPRHELCVTAWWYSAVP